MKLTNYMRDAFISRVMADVPSVDYTEQIRSETMKAAISLLPPKVRAVYEDKASRDYVQTFYCYEGVGMQLPGLDSKATLAKIKPLIASTVEKKERQEKARKELQQKLRGCAYAVTTRKALAEMLPEFAKYLPEDEAAVNRSLPVVANVVSDFVKAGWPKGKKPLKAAAGG